MPARSVVLCWRAEEFAEPDTLPLLQALRAEGFGAGHVNAGHLAAIAWSQEIGRADVAY